MIYKLKDLKIDDSKLVLKTACELLTPFFNNDKKVQSWLKTNNPLLGDLKPMSMIVLGRGAKLIRFIEFALAENKRD